MSGEARKPTIYFSEPSKRGRSSIAMARQQQQAAVDTELMKTNQDNQKLMKENEDLTSENARLLRDITKLSGKNKFDHELMYKVDYENLEYIHQKKVAETQSKESEKRLKKQEIESKTLNQLVKKLEKELALHSKNPFEGNVEQHKKPSGVWLEELIPDSAEAEKQNALNEDSARSEAQEALALLIRRYPKQN